MARTRTADRLGSDARDRILRSAHDVFAAQGYRGASLDAVAVGAGISRAGLLHHFENKQALLIALLNARDEQLELSGFSLGPGVDSAATLMETMRRSVREILDGRELVKLAHTLTAEAADDDHPAHEWLVQRSRRLRESMRAIFDAAVERGEFTAAVDSATLAALCLAAVEGLEAQWLADPDRVDVEAGLALLESLILRALGPTPPAA